MKMLKSYPASEMEAYPVSGLVSSPANNSPECIKPYRIKSHDMGLKQGISIDNIQELLSHIEGEDFK
jgi:hypothetical protein